jgi:hypothetical protein
LSPLPLIEERGPKALIFFKEENKVFIEFIKFYKNPGRKLMYYQ